MISCSCRWFFLFNVLKSFFILIISLNCASWSLPSSYSLSFLCFSDKFDLYFSARSNYNFSTLSYSFDSRFLSSFLKSSASSTLSSRETNFSCIWYSFNFFLGLILTSSTALPSLSSRRFLSSTYLNYSSALLYPLYSSNFLNSS